MAILDIEILEERVRDGAARSSVQEAVKCYKAGAYRSCVIQTWIALVHDFVGKFRDLAIHGDASAQKLVAEFDRIQRERDTDAALKFERDVLGIALGDYELISPQEFAELRRLFEDRNRFGHPNLNQDAEVLDASPELARAHLRSAVDYVLSRPPVQGKGALTQIRSAVDSQYFPRNQDDAEKVLSATPLARAKKNVVREFYLGSITSLVREELSVDVFERRLYGAAACRKMHGVLVDLVIADKVGSVFDKSDDKCLPYIIVLGVKAPELLKVMSPGLRVRLKAFVKDIPADKLAVLNFASEYDFLRAEVVGRLSGISAGAGLDFVRSTSRLPAKPVVDWAVDALVNSKSWDSSNSLCTAIAERMIDLLDAGNIRGIIDSAANDEVSGSFNYAPLIKKMFDAGRLSADDLKRIAAAGDTRALRQLIPEEEGE